MIRTPVFVMLVFTLITTQFSFATTLATPPATVQSTQQLPGGPAQIGTTYTLYKGTDAAINITLKSLEYSVDHSFYDQGDELPPPGKKNLVLHLTLQNPQTADMYLSQTTIRFTGVDSSDKDVEGIDFFYDERTHLRNTSLLKPGQKVEVYTVIVMDSGPSLPKLILNDSDSTVLRYDLHGKITPLPASFSDPASADGSAALDIVRARTGVYYPGTFDLRIDQVKYVDTPLLDETLPDGGRMISVLATLRNPLPVPQDLYYHLIDPSITTQEDLTTDHQSTLYLASRDATLEGSLGAGKEIQIRLAFPVEHGVVPKALLLQVMNSRTYSIDMANLGNAGGTANTAPTQTGSASPSPASPASTPAPTGTTGGGCVALTGVTAG